MSIRILITGERQSLPTQLANGKEINWIAIPTLAFERLPFEEAGIDFVSEPFNWIFFSSQRGAQFFLKWWHQNGLAWPKITKFASMGPATSREIEQFGLEVSFCPQGVGSETFIEQFQKKYPITRDLRVLLPGAESGRSLLFKTLLELGCQVVKLPVYRTVPHPQLGNVLNRTSLQGVDGILFTSPSSVEAVLTHYDLPKETKLISLGEYTSQHLSGLGYASEILPDGDFKRVEETL